MRVSHAIFAILFSAGSAYAQFGFGFGVGVKGGLNTVDVIKSSLPGSNTTSPTNYVVGPVAEVRLPLGFAFEADGLYTRKNEYTFWEVPYMAKFRFPIPLIKPFVVAGGTYRSFVNGPANSSLSNSGFVTGLGLELRLARLRFSAEGRYQRWGAGNPDVGFFSAERNQGQVLFGFIF